MDLKGRRRLDEKGAKAPFVKTKTQSRPIVDATRAMYDDSAGAGCHRAKTAKV